MAPDHILGRLARESRQLDRDAKTELEHDAFDAGFDYALDFLTRRDKPD